MNVWRKQTTQWVVRGKRVSAETPHAKQRTIYSKRFYGTLALASGKRKQTPLTEDAETSRTLLRRLQTAEDTKRANGADRYSEERQRPLGELLTAYSDYLTIKANTPLHVKMSLSRCRAVVAAIGAKTYGDLDGRRILKALSEWRKRKEKPIGVTASNHYLVAIKSFSRWLWTQRTSPDDPLAGLRKLNAETDRRRVRRALTGDELATLTRVTQSSKKRYRGDNWQFLATDRAMLYTVAAFTGLRAGELASLTKASFDFAAGTFTLEAASAKNRKRTTLPLHPALAEKLQTWFATLKRETLWPGTWVARRMAGKVLKRDLKRAGIAYRDATGRCVDFHALRYTFITGLAKAGVHPAKAQRLARHSSITLTMDVYTSLDVDDLRESLNSLPFNGSDANDH